MLKRGLVSLVLVFALVISFCGASYADVLPLYRMQLTVQQSPIDIYPPVMIYTAQISPVPPVIQSQPVKVDFYNSKDGSGLPAQLIGTAIVDSTGKAVLNKQMAPGAYTAVATTVVSGENVVSNNVQYKVY